MPPAPGRQRHIYFRQTAYSVQKFDKEIHIADLSKPDEHGKYPSLFDMKGIGAGGYVVAAGSVRDTGEIYLDNGNVPVAPIPDWLVDWVLKEREKYRSESARLREKVKAQLAAAAQAKQAGNSAPVPREHVRTAIKSRVGTFASLGVRRKTIERLVKEQIEDFIQDGPALAAEYKDFIHEEVFNPKLRIGKLRTEFLPARNVVTIAITIIPPCPTADFNWLTVWSKDFWLGTVTWESCAAAGNASNAATTVAISSVDKRETAIL